MSLPPCPKCQSEYVYEDQANLVCPECGHEWNPADNSDDDAFVVRDSNGKVLEVGDQITLIKGEGIIAAAEDRFKNDHPPYCGRQGSRAGL